jgi:flagellar biosynthesis/type III secretory pathway protein FliH
MSSENAINEDMTSPDNPAVFADQETWSGKLEDAEIQRLVALSQDARYKRSERIPVRPVESFEPRSLVSIAMEAQRRREAEARNAAEIAAANAAGNAGVAGPDTVGEVPPGDLGTNIDPGVEAGIDPAIDTAVDMGADAQLVQQPEVDELGTEAGEGAIPFDEAKPSSTVDFDAGRLEGVEEGRKVGFDEGHSKGMAEGRAAGQAEASAQLERTIQAFEAATAKLNDLAEIDSVALGESINKAILTLASERAGQAIAELPAAFADRIETLLATVRTVSGEPRIRLNAGDLASIKPLVETREKLRHCIFIADEAMAKGDLSVSLGTIGIDDILVTDSPANAPANASVDAPTSAADMPTPTGEVAASDFGSNLGSEDAPDQVGNADDMGEPIDG